MSHDICIYHGPGCMDGLVAAWAIWKRWPDIQFIPAQYGQAPPDVAGKHVLIVDFSYKRPVLEEMAKTAASITILDHHKSAQADLDEYNWGGFSELLDTDQWPVDGLRIQAVFDMERSGARLAWQYAHPGQDVPAIVLHAEDRDLWRFDMRGTREVHAFLASQPETFESVDNVAIGLEVAAGEVFMGGASILRQHDKDVARLIAVGRQMRVIGGHEVPMVNAPPWMASDVGNVLAVGHPFAATVYFTAAAKWSFSLRSAPDGIDVSEIAAKFGGGGHKHAAGFMVDTPPWGLR